MFEGALGLAPLFAATETSSAAVRPLTLRTGCSRQTIAHQVSVSWQQETPLSRLITFKATLLLEELLVRCTALCPRTVDLLSCILAACFRSASVESSSL